MKRLNKIKKWTKALAYITKGNKLIHRNMLDMPELHFAFTDYLETFQNLITELMEATRKAKDHDLFDGIMKENFK